MPPTATIVALVTATDLEKNPGERCDAVGAIARLEQIGREIEARVEKLDKLGAKAVDQVDSIDHLLAEAERLCTPEAFATFKQKHCPTLSRSRTYELLAIKEGRKSLEEIRTSTRARVAKHRAAKNPVTDSSSVTLNGQILDLDKLGPGAQAQIEAAAREKQVEASRETAEESAERRKAEYAAKDVEECTVVTGSLHEDYSNELLVELEKQLQTIIGQIDVAERTAAMLILHMVEQRKQTVRSIAKHIGMDPKWVKDKLNSVRPVTEAAA